MRDVATDSTRQLGEGGDRRILLTPFDLTTITSVHAGFEGELFLGKPLELSRLPNPLADHLQ